MVRYDTGAKQRRSLRLKGYNYAQPAAYFVTICIQGRQCLLGDVMHGQMVLNEAGRMVTRVWGQMPERFANMAADEFIVMPNHVHGIIIVTDEAAGGSVSSLADVVGAFKSLTTTEYIQGIKKGHWMPFEGKLWQRNYYEHIVRNEAEMNGIREYIITNAERWDEDPEHPDMQQDTVIRERHVDIWKRT